MRNTRQRNLVLEIINNSCNHLTAYQVHQDCLKIIPNISLGTVYRNLYFLVKLGKIQKLEIPNQMTRYDKALGHAHFICLCCGKVYDLKKIKISYDKIIDGNKVCACKINYEGVCYDCLNNNCEGEDIDGIKGK